MVGLLDITKVFHEALAKVERSSSASQQLHAALAGVQSELGGMAQNPQQAAMMAYAEQLRERMALPDLTTVMNPRESPPVVSPRTSVRDAAKLMKERRTTAVCVMDTQPGSNVSGTSGPNKIQGIFTSKDVVLRTIAAGLDPQRCSVVRVMTPHPDTAPPTMSVQDALKKMYAGHYLNLPVVDADGRLAGIVDVLKLTYATLEQIESMAENAGATSSSDAGGGPMWGKFFDDLGQAGPVDDDSTSMLSGADAPMTPSIPRHMRGISSATSPYSELHPGDSASAAEDGNSEVGGARGGGAAASSVAPPASIVDDGTYIFKFRTPSGRTHRFQARNDNVENLRDIVAGKLLSDPFFTAEDAKEGQVVHLPDPSVFVMSYTDDDGDLVTISTDGDVTDAVRIARSQRSDRVVLVISGDKVWEEAAREYGAPKQDTEALKRAAEELVREDKEEVALENKAADPAEVPTYGQSEKVHAHKGAMVDDDKVMGIPKELLLPASIGFLGVVVLGVFIATRSSKK